MNYNFINVINVRSKISPHWKNILYKMILCYLYQNLINKKYVYKNTYSLTQIFNLLREYLYIFIDISHTNIDTIDMESIPTDAMSSHATLFFSDFLFYLWNSQNETQSFCSHSQSPKLKVKHRWNGQFNHKIILLNSSVIHNKIKYKLLF